MMKRGSLTLCMVVIALLAGLIAPAHAAAAQVGEGWSLSPGEVRLGGINPGQTASFKIKIANHKDFPLNFFVSAIIPRTTDLRPEYEQFPDSGWISIAPQHIELAEFSQEEVTVTVTVPEEGDWGGRNYECWLNATSDSMGVLRVVLACRLLLSTSHKYAPGADWPVIGSSVGILIIAAGLIHGNRRKLKRWFTRPR